MEWFCLWSEFDDFPAPEGENSKAAGLETVPVTVVSSQLLSWIEEGEWR